jgi:hypothetical protein
MGKISSVWSDGVQCSVMSYLKHLKISSSKSLIVVSLPLNTTKFCKALVDATIRFQITQNGLKMRKNPVCASNDTKIAQVG